MHDIRFIPEWESCEAIMLALPHENTDWAPILEEAIVQYRRMIKAFVTGGEHCLIISPSRKYAEECLTGIPDDNISIVEIATNDTWTRDYGPISVVRHGRLRAIDFGFNGWGLKFAADKDNLVNFRLMEKFLINPKVYRNRRNFILEGGSLETDGEGTLLTTSKCLLSQNRNGGLSKKDAGNLISEELGVEHILWLDYGALMGDDTDSHIDTLCRIAPNNTILFTGCRNVDDPQFEELLKMRAQLTMFRDMNGEPFNLIELPLPDPIYDEDGERLPATYANYLITPRSIFVPTYDQPQNDMLAMHTLKVAFPKHNIVPVDCRTLIKQHGSLHCSTMQLPSNLVSLLRN
jgi:agmatine/peptidylarginine deiminase